MQICLSNRAEDDLGFVRLLHSFTKTAQVLATGNFKLLIHLQLTCLIPLMPVAPTINIPASDRNTFHNPVRHPDVDRKSKTRINVCYNLYRRAKVWRRIIVCVENMSIVYLFHYLIG